MPSHRSPKHACPDCNTDPYVLCAYHSDPYNYGPRPDADADCNCDPLTDGYANIECHTHGIPIQRPEQPS